MRFFTREWASGTVSDKKYTEVYTAYRQHIKSLLSSLPKPLVELTKLSLHDSLIRCVVVDRSMEELGLKLRSGDNEIGYFDLDISYSGVRFEALDAVTLANRARDPQTEILYDEIDLGGDKGFIHRILFWPEGEVSIAFFTLRLSRIDQPNRYIQHAEDAYLEIA